jgi:uncharacterized membrane protein YfcA
MSSTQILLSLGIGVISGVIAALCGVGGGVVMVPAFVFFLGMTQKNAVATSLMVMIATALTTTVQNTRNGFGDWRFALVTALASAFVAWFAADLLRSISNQALTRIFGGILIATGIYMLAQKG